MAHAAQKPKKKLGSTQKFTEIEDIQEDIVILSGKQACLILEVQASNFSLLSEMEKAAKITAYGQLLNSLSFPIQILIRSKRINVLSYIKLLDYAIQSARNEIFRAYRKRYKEYVQELTRINTLLDKKFYVVIPFSHLEMGPVGVKSNDFFLSAKTTLRTKAESLLTQLNRLSLRASILDKEELIKLFYDIYNQELDESYKIDNVVHPPVVTTSNVAVAAQNAASQGGKQ